MRRPNKKRTETQTAKLMSTFVYIGNDWHRRSLYEAKTMEGLGACPATRIKEPTHIYHLKFCVLEYFAIFYQFYVFKNSILAQMEYMELKANFQ